MTENKISFSVVIPVYNGELFIADAIESCLRQTVTPDEIIVIDDASIDHTAAVIKKMDSSLVVYRRNETNQGPSFCRNIGMQLAKCSWITFLDADDIFHPKKIEIIRFYISHNQNIKAIGHSFNFVSDPLFVPDESWQQKALPSVITVKQMLVRNRMVTPSLAVAVSNGLLFDESMSYAEDHDFILRTTEKFGIWFLDMRLCSLGRIPLTAGGITNNRWEMRKGEINMYINYCKRNGLTLAIPFFIIFSLLKHAKNALFYRKG